MNKFVLGFILLVLLSGCAGLKPSSTVTISVVDASTDLPVDGALVEVFRADDVAHSDLLNSGLTGPPLNDPGVAVIELDENADVVRLRVSKTGYEVLPSAVVIAAPNPLRLVPFSVDLDFERVRSGEMQAFGSYTRKWDRGECGDDSGEYLVYDSEEEPWCCAFPFSVVEAGTCIQEDGRMRGRKISLILTDANPRASASERYENTSPELKISNKILKDDVDSVGPYTARVVDSSGAVLNSYDFEFTINTVVYDLAPECADGACDFTPVEEVNFPCYANAARVQVFDEEGSLIVDEGVAELC